jgi:Ner family transcriptional regulator
MRRRWHPEDIKAEVRKTGTTLTRLALESGLDASACRVALVRPYPRAEQAISELLGVSLHLLWPARYEASGRRRSHHVRETSITNRRESLRQNGQAA